MDQYFTNKQYHMAAYGTVWQYCVNPLVQNSNSLLEDLRRLSQLKDNPYLHDLKTDQSKQPLTPARGEKLKR